MKISPIYENPKSKESVTTFNESGTKLKKSGPTLKKSGPKNFQNSGFIFKIASTILLLSIILNIVGVFGISAAITNKPLASKFENLNLSDKTVDFFATKLSSKSNLSSSKASSSKSSSKSSSINTSDETSVSSGDVIDGDPIDDEFAPLYRKGMVSAGLYHNIMLNNDGRVYCWGDNSYGQLGIGTTDSEDSPTLVPDLVDIIMVAAGAYHSVALDKDGNVYTFGRNTFGQLGNGNSQASLSPVRVDDIPPIKEISAGGFHTLALSMDGEVYAWGSNNDYQIGDVLSENITDDAGNILGKRVTKPQQIVVSGVISVSAGGNHSLYLNSKGEVFAWGYNKEGELGDGSQTSRGLPTKIDGLESIVKISAGYAHNLALKEIIPNKTEKIDTYQNLYVWGSAADGQLGLGAKLTKDDKDNYVARPTRIDVTDDSNEKNDYISLAEAGYANSVITVPVIKNKKRYDSIYVWGNNTYGQLGIGDLPSQNSPVEMIASSNEWMGNTFLPFQSISIGGYHVIYMSVKGFVGTVGRANKGQLGNVSVIDSKIPIGVLLPDAIAPEWKTGEKLESSISGQTITLEWNNAKDNIKVTDYIVYYIDKNQENKSIKTSFTNKYIISDYDSTIPQIITVKAIDKAGNKSQKPLEYDYIPSGSTNLTSETSQIIEDSSLQDSVLASNSSKAKTTINQSVKSTSKINSMTSSSFATEPDITSESEFDFSSSGEISEVTPTGDADAVLDIDPLVWSPENYGDIVPMEVPWNVDYIYGAGVVLPPNDYSWIIVLSITIAIVLFFLIITLVSFKKKHQDSNLFKGMYLELKKLLTSKKANKSIPTASPSDTKAVGSDKHDVLSVGDSIDIINTDDNDEENNAN